MDDAIVIIGSTRHRSRTNRIKCVRNPVSVNTEAGGWMLYFGDGAEGVLDLRSVEHSHGAGADAGDGRATCLRGVVEEVGMDTRRVLGE